MIHHIYEITDDSGFMALLDPAAYKSFVDSNWTLAGLFGHFATEMRNRHLAIWGTGREDVWRVEIRFHQSSEIGFREFSTQISASADHLLLTNYESLTMAAQFEDVSLPEAHQRNLLVPISPGKHECRIVQRFDPGLVGEEHRKQSADFLIELVPSAHHGKTSEVLQRIPWSYL